MSRLTKMLVAHGLIWLLLLIGSLCETLTGAIGLAAMALFRWSETEDPAR